MFSFRKYLYLLLSLFGVFTLFMGIKATVFPSTDLTDIKLLGAGAITFIFAIAVMINLYIRNTEKYKFMWITGISFSLLALLIWLIILFGPLFEYLYQIAMVCSVLSFTLTNFGVVNIAEQSSFFVPIFIKITKVTCILTAISMTILILGWYQDSGFTIKGFIISFLTLCYCNFIILILHRLALKKKNINNLSLTPTDTNEIYADSYGNQYLVKQLNDVQKINIK